MGVNALLAHLSVTARPALGPLVDLEPSAHASLTAAAVSHWLGCGRFDDWGAFMYLHGPSRRIYARAGLEIEVSQPERLPSANPLWRGLLAGARECSLTLDQRLYYARLLLYLGMYAAAATQVEACRAHPDAPRVALWIAYLAALADQMPAPGIWNPGGLEAALAQPSNPGPVAFQAALQLAAHYIRFSTDEAPAERFLARATSHLAAMGESGWQLDLATARLERHMAAWRLRLGDVDGHRQLLHQALQRLGCCLPDDRNAALPGEFLPRETARRICTHGMAAALGRGALRESLGYARLAYRLDPTCASAQLHLGEVLFHCGEPDLARRWFERAAITGLLERPHALLRAAQCRAGTSLTDDDLVEAVSADYFEDPQTAAVAAELLPYVNAHAGTTRLTRPWLELRAAGAAPAASAPIAVERVEDLVRALPPERADARRLIERSEVFRRLPVFWTLGEGPGDAETPYWARQPRNAWQVLKEQREPWFRAVYYQSTAGPDVRDRLLWYALGAWRPAADGPLFGETLATLDGTSPEMSELVSRFRAAGPHTPALERARLARVLGYLAFCDEALRLTSVPWDQPRWSDADAALAYTNLFFRYISGGDATYAEDCERAFYRMPGSDASLRTRLVLAISCGGFCGKQRDIARAAAWRERGAEVLEAVQRCRQFSPEEQTLLTSRYWRFASFIPYLRNDRPALLEETDLYERLARECGWGDAYARENMYAALETRARIQEYLGDLAGAIAYLQELARDVDPLDCKVWLNLGDLREKQGDFAGAVRDFMAAARLAPPGRELAWFRAGVCYEQLGEPREAIRCHLRSLWSYPLGKSPLFAVLRLSHATGDAYLAGWARAALQSLAASKGLDESLAGELAAVLESTNGE